MFKISCASFYKDSKTHRERRIEREYNIPFTGGSTPVVCCHQQFSYCTYFSRLSPSSYELLPVTTQAGKVRGKGGACLYIFSLSCGLTLAEAGREVGPLAAEVGRERGPLATEACRDGPRLPAEDAPLMGAASAYMAETASPERYEIISMEQGVTKRCRLSFLTNSALVIRVPMRGEGGVAGSQPMSKAVHIT